MDPNTPNKPAGEGRIPIKSLRTYQGDVEEAISKNKYSTSDIFMSEQKKREAAPAPTQEPQKEDGQAKRRFLFLAGGLLFLLGIISLGAIYYLKPSNNVVVEQKTKTLIGFSQEKTINLTTLDRTQLINGVGNEKTKFNFPVNSTLHLKLIGPDKTELSKDDMLSLLGPSMPSSLVRSFTDKYMLGVYSFDTNEVFLILTTDDYALSYSGMLKWESAMTDDLRLIFGLPRTADSSAWTWKDEALKNKDLRVLVDENKKTLFLYSFIDRNTIVITKNENIFNAIVSKYLISKQSK